MLGGLFLMLSYFGCDQSQVQRYLTAKSIDEARHSLLMSAYVKIPLQLLILATGVLVFVFYLFQTPPMLFNRVYDAQRRGGPACGRVRGARSRQFDVAIAARRAGSHAVDREAFSRATRASRTSAQRRRRSSSGRTRRRPVQRRQLRVSDVHHDANADRAGGADDRRDLRGGDVGQRRAS